MKRELLVLPYCLFGHNTKDGKACKGFAAINSSFDDFNSQHKSAWRGCATATLVVRFFNVYCLS